MPDVAACLTRRDWVVPEEPPPAADTRSHREPLRRPAVRPGRDRPPPRAVRGRGRAPPDALAGSPTRHPGAPHRPGVARAAPQPPDRGGHRAAPPPVSTAGPVAATDLVTGAGTGAMIGPVTS